MTDEIWQRDEIESPCQKICLMHEGAGLCIGCHRSRAEIAGWSRMTRAERAAILADLPGRAPAFRGKRRGRAARRND